MKKYSPTNPAFDAMLSIETILGRMKPKKLQSTSSRGLMGSSNNAVKQTMSDGREQVAKYVKAIRDVREQNRNG